MQFTFHNIIVTQPVLHAKCPSFFRHSRYLALHVAQWPRSPIHTAVSIWLRKKHPLGHVNRRTSLGHPLGSRDDRRSYAKYCTAAPGQPSTWRWPTRATAAALRYRQTPASRFKSAIMPRALPRDVLQLIPIASGALSSYADCGRSFERLYSRPTALGICADTTTTVHEKPSTVDAAHGNNLFPEKKLNTGPDAGDVRKAHQLRKPLNKPACCTLHSFCHLTMTSWTTLHKHAHR